MAVDQLSIKIGADAGAAIAGFTNLDKAVSKTVASTEKASASLGKSGAALDKLGDGSVKAAGGISQVATSLNSFPDLASGALARINAKIDEIAEGAQQSKVKLVELGNARLPLASINAYHASILKIKRDLSLVTLTPPRGLDKIPQSASKAADGIAKVGAATGKSNQRMLEFGRVIQDLPFGFAGIANNLTQLIPAVGGLGLAFSVLVSAVTFAQIGFGAWTRGMGGSSKAISDHAEAIREAKKALQDYVESLDVVNKARITGAQNAQEELVKLKTLYDATQNANIPLAQRKKLVDELQEQYPKTFANISDEIILAGKAGDAYNSLATSIQNAARARAAQELLIDTQKELLVNDSQLVKSAQDQAATLNKINDLKKKGLSLTYEDNLGVKKTTDEGKKLSKLQDEYNAKNKATNAIIEARKKLVSDANKLAKELNATVEQDPNSLLDPGGNIKAPKIEKPKVEKPDFSYFEKYLSFDPTKVKEKTKEFAEAFDLFAQFALKNREIFVGLDEILKIDSKKNAIIEAAKWWKDYENGIYQLKPQRIEIEGPQINTSIDQIAGPGRELKAPQLPRIDTSEIQAQYKELETMIQGFNTSLAVSVGEGIGDAIATGDFSNIFKGIASVIGSFIQELGKYLIKASIAKEAFDKAIAVLLSVTGGGAVGLAAGIALVAVGGAIKSNIPKFKGFAKGGFVPGQGSGDTVPAMLTPGEYVVRKQDVPLFMSIIKLLEGNKIGSSIKDISGRMGFADGGFVPSVRSVSQQRNGSIGNITIKQPAVIIMNQRMRGRDLVLQQARENSSQRRTR